MKIKFECDYCQKQFESKYECYDHELSEHIDNADKIKYYIMNISNKDICSCCSELYYVYGCEPDCSHKDCKRDNNYKDFKWNGGDIKYDFQRNFR